MKKILLIFILPIGLLFFVSCNESTSKQKTAAYTVSENLNSFPEFLVGQWKSQDTTESVWEFTFKADGKISSMRNFMGIDVNVAEGQAQDHIADVNIERAFMLGPVETNYDSNNRTLTVNITTDYYMLNITGQMIEGSSLDIITGTISEDNKIWDAQWRSISGMPNNPPIADSNDASVSSVIFYKAQ